jgi:hypothetical protein
MVKRVEDVHDPRVVLPLNTPRGKEQLNTALGEIRD